MEEERKKRANEEIVGKIKGDDGNKKDGGNGSKEEDKGNKPGTPAPMQDFHAAIKGEDSKANTKKKAHKVG